MLSERDWACLFGLVFSLSHSIRKEVGATDAEVAQMEACLNGVALLLNKVKDRQEAEKEDDDGL